MVCIFQHIALRWAFRHPNLKFILTIFFRPLTEYITPHVEWIREGRPFGIHPKSPGGVTFGGHPLGVSDCICSVVEPFGRHS